MTWNWKLALVKWVKLTTATTKKVCLQRELVLQKVKYRLLLKRNEKDKKEGLKAVT